VAVGIAALALLVSGCGGAEAESGSNPYESEFKQSLSVVSTDFERQILEDHVISDAEYAEARTRLQQCVEGQGFELELTPDGTVLTATDETQAAAEAAFEECEMTTVINIEALYWAVRTNPHKEDKDELSARCLREAGLVGPEFDGQAFDETFADPPFDRTDPRAATCINDPLSRLSG